MTQVITRDARFDVKGPGQEQDNLLRRALIASEIERERQRSFEYHSLFGNRVQIDYVVSTRIDPVDRLRQSRKPWPPPKQIHTIGQMYVYILKTDIHGFALSTSGKIMKRRSLSSGNPDDRTLLWFELGDVYNSRPDNGVLRGCLLPALMRRD